jgi:hypothetical protein
VLGKFLELSLVVPDASSAWLQYQQLGFAGAETGDVYAHAYGVVTCEGLAIGLHGAGPTPLTVCFVRPEVAALHRELAAVSIDVEAAHLGSDVFNDLALREPGGALLRVLEARSFSPPLESPRQTLVGTFTGLSLPARDMDEASRFWQRLHYRAEPLAEDEPGFAVAGTPLRYHPWRMLAEPALLFTHPQPELASMPGSAGLSHEKPLALLRHRAHQLLRTTEGLALIVLD